MEATLEVVGSPVLVKGARKDITPAVHPVAFHPPSPTALLFTPAPTPALSAFDTATGRTSPCPPVLEPFLSDVVGVASSASTLVLLTRDGWAVSWRGGAATHARPAPFGAPHPPPSPPTPRRLTVNTAPPSSPPPFLASPARVRRVPSKPTGLLFRRRQVPALVPAVAACAVSQCGGVVAAMVSGCAEEGVVWLWRGAAWDDPGGEWSRVVHATLPATPLALRVTSASVVVAGAASPPGAASPALAVSSWVAAVPALHANVQGVTVTAACTTVSATLRDARSLSTATFLGAIHPADGPTAVAVNVDTGGHVPSSTLVLAGGSTATATSVSALVAGGLVPRHPGVDTGGRNPLHAASLAWLPAGSTLAVLVGDGNLLLFTQGGLPLRLLPSPALSRMCGWQPLSPSAATATSPFSAPLFGPGSALGTGAAPRPTLAVAPAGDAVLVASGAAVVTVAVPVWAAEGEAHPHPRPPSPSPVLFPPTAGGYQDTLALRFGDGMSRRRRRRVAAAAAVPCPPPPPPPALPRGVPTLAAALLGDASVRGVAPSDYGATHVGAAVPPDLPLAAVAAFRELAAVSPWPAAAAHPGFAATLGAAVARMVGGGGDADDAATDDGNSMAGDSWPAAGVVSTVAAACGGAPRPHPAAAARLAAAAAPLASPADALTVATLTRNPAAALRAAAVLGGAPGTVSPAVASTALAGVPPAAPTALRRVAARGRAGDGSAGNAAAVCGAGAAAAAGRLLGKGGGDAALASLLLAGLDAPGALGVALRRRNPGACGVVGRAMAAFFRLGGGGACIPVGAPHPGVPRAALAAAVGLAPAWAPSTGVRLLFAAGDVPAATAACVDCGGRVLGRGAAAAVVPDWRVNAALLARHRGDLHHPSLAAALRQRARLCLAGGQRATLAGVVAAARAHLPSGPAAAVLAGIAVDALRRLAAAVSRRAPLAGAPPLRELLGVGGTPGDAAVLQAVDAVQAVVGGAPALCEALVSPSPPGVVSGLAVGLWLLHVAHGAPAGAPRWAARRMALAASTHTSPPARKAIEAAAVEGLAAGVAASPEDVVWGLAWYVRREAVADENRARLRAVRTAVAGRGVDLAAAEAEAEAKGGLGGGGGGGGRPVPVFPPAAVAAAAADPEFGAMVAMVSGWLADTGIAHHLPPPGRIWSPAAPSPPVGATPRWWGEEGGVGVVGVAGVGVRVGAEAEAGAEVEAEVEAEVGAEVEVVAEAKVDAEAGGEEPPLPAAVVDVVPPRASRPSPRRRPKPKPVRKLLSPRARRLDANPPPSPIEPVMVVVKLPASASPRAKTRRKKPGRRVVGGGGVERVTARPVTRAVARR